VAMTRFMVVVGWNEQRRASCWARRNS